MNVIRSLRLKLSVDNPNALIQTFSAYNRAFEVCATWGYQNKKSNKILNHQATYQLIREEIPELPSALLQGARDCACEALKSTKCKVLPVRKQFSAMRYNQRVVNVNLIRGIVTMSSVLGRVKAQFKLPVVYEKYLSWKLKSSTLQFKKQINEFYLIVHVEFDEIPEQDETILLGVDRGVNNIAVCSDGHFFGSSKVKNVRCKYRRLRAKLQSKGTKSAKRLLKRMSGKERRFQTDVNHHIAKSIVNKPVTVIVLEDLTGIRPNKKEGTSKGKQNFWLSNWSFCQLEQFIEYKAESLGKIMLKIDPAYTSQECSACGKVNKSSRNGLIYKCKSCGFELNADLNASRNIANRGMTVVSRVLSTIPTHQHQS
jgi:IS605 OrfB family transposase